MSGSTEFLVENDSDSKLCLFVEPEGMVVWLQRGESVVVRDQYEKAPLTIRVSQESSGAAVLSLWPGDGAVTVTKDGRDVLDTS